MNLILVEQQSHWDLQRIINFIPKLCSRKESASSGAPIRGVINSEDVRTYPVQFWFFMTKTMAGKSRGLQIAMNYGVFGIALCFLIVPLFLFIYVLAAGCYRVTTNSAGIVIKKFTGNFFSWDDVDNIDFTKYHITITNYGAAVDEASILIFTLKSKQGKSVTFKMRSFEAKNFIAELVQRKKMPEEMLEMFI